MSLIKLAEKSFRQIFPKETFFDMAEKRFRKSHGGKSISNLSDEVESSKLKAEGQKCYRDLWGGIHAEKYQEASFKAALDESRYLRAKQDWDAESLHAEDAFKRYNKYKNYVKNKNIKRAVIGGVLIGAAGIGAELIRRRNKNKENAK